MLNHLKVSCLIAVFCCIGSTAKSDVSDLQQLLDGGQLVEGNTTFSNFQLLANLGTDSFDASMVNVETLGGVGLNFFGNDQFSLDAGGGSLIFQLGFDATTTGTSWQFSGVDLVDGNPNISGDGLVDIFNSISGPDGSVVAETNAVVDPGFGINQLSDNEVFEALSDVSFVSSFSLFADDSTPVSIDSYRVTLAVPEPSSAVIVLGLSAFTFFRRKK